MCCGSQNQLELLVNTRGPEKEVSELVEHIWKEAMGKLEDVLSVSIDSIKVEQVRSDDREVPMLCFSYHEEIILLLDQPMSHSTAQKHFSSCRTFVILLNSLHEALKWCYTNV